MCTVPYLMYTNYKCAILIDVEHSRDEPAKRRADYKMKMQTWCYVKCANFTDVHLKTMNTD